ncbi:glycosyltransferase family 2 protein [Megasphaera elsdenii]|uniref:glycosyltransferase family 2 protein n=1 Tax=Megasphaera elsdenii TaxID=907 RepID=UPI00090EE1FD|nr:glycosyltransferase family 2 protein [Megasphaera elsdenii]SHK08767.1 teichuronic acid biosynthesis glycosyltransferase TuaG [Megasphaera elsdenii]
MSYKTPLVSVIMPTYNCGNYILQSIDSVLAQSMNDWEIQIVDDCSTDDTKSVLAPYLEKFPNIHYYCLPKNGGPAVARTEAMKRASGKYIAFLDSDDLWSPDKLEKQIAFMEKTGANFSCTAYAQMDADGKPLHVALYPPEHVDYKRCIRLSNPIGNLTAMYDQEALGKFTVPLIKKRNDFALWLQILKKTPYCYGMQEVLGTYRLGRKGSVSSNKLKQAKYHWQLYHEIEGHSSLRSLYELCCWAWVKGTKMGLKRKESRQ